MTEQLILWAFGLLIAALFALVGVLYRANVERLRDLEREAGDLSEFLARDGERERSWWSWRESFDEGHERRRSEIDKRLDSHAEDLKDYGQRITRLERNGHAR